MVQLFRIEFAREFVANFCGEFDAKFDTFLDEHVAAVESGAESDVHGREARGDPAEGGV